MKKLMIAGLFAVLTGCATGIPPEVVAGYTPTQDIETYCAAKGAGEKPEWLARCTNAVAFRARSTSFCQACAAKGGSFNACLRKAATMREEGIKSTPKGQQPAILLTCDKTQVSCVGFPDSTSERVMKLREDVKVDLTSYPGSSCPLQKSVTR